MRNVEKHSVRTTWFLLLHHTETVGGGTNGIFNSFKISIEPTETVQVEGRPTVLTEI